jgi:hypothetical protein
MVIQNETWKANSQTPNAWKAITTFANAIVS